MILNFGKSHLSDCEQYLVFPDKPNVVQTLGFYCFKYPSPASSHHLAEALCSMPNLTNLILKGFLHEEFYSTLKAKASSIQVQTVKLDGLWCPTVASSYLLAEALCYMPNLTDLTLQGDIYEEFYSALKAEASSIQVQTVKLDDLLCPIPASLHLLAEALCSMPNLTDLILGGFLNEGFCSTLKAKASSIQVQTVKLDSLYYPTPASSHLAEALCSMPNLTDLTLGMHINEEFYSTLKAKASSMQGCFPQIRKGNFRFNGVAQDDLNSFLHTLARFQRSRLQLLRGSYHGNTYNTGDVSSEQSRAMYQGTMASTSLVNPVHANTSVSLDTLPRGLGVDIPVLQESQDDALVRQALQQPGTLKNQSGILPVYLENNALPWNPEPSQPQFMPSNLQSGMSAGYHTSAPYQPYSGYNCSPKYREAYYNPTYHSTLSSSAPSPNPPVSSHNQPTMSAGYLSPTQYPQPIPESTGAVHSTNFSSPIQSTISTKQANVHYQRRALPSSDHPQQQPLGDVLYQRTLPPSDHSQQQPTGDVHYPRRTLTPSDHPQQQPTGDVHYPRRTLPSSDHPQQQPTGDVHYPRRTLPPSDHPQQQPTGDVHYPRRTLPPSDHPQLQPTGDVHYPRRTLPTSDHPQQQPMGNVHYPRRALPPSDHPQQQPMGDVHYPRRTLPPSDHPQQQPMGDVHYPRRTLPPSDHPQQQPTGDVHYPRRALPPSDHPQQQPMGDVHSSRRALPSSDHPQQQPMGDVHYPRRTLPPSDHPQQQPMGDVHYLRNTLPQSDHPQQQPMGDVHYPRMTLPQSDHPQQQPMADVHYPSRTLPPSDHPQPHVGNTPYTVFQLSQTHREGSSSLSMPYKRQTTCTQSRVPQDDPEIPEKQSKYEV